jgi:nucleoside-diphosphate-sugar epimerase
MESRGKVLITGTEGLIGRPLHGALLDRGYEVVPYDAKGDRNIFDRAALEEHLQGCDTVIHLAAISWPKPDKRWEDFWLQNCQGTFEVAEAARQAGVQRFIFTSSTSYYGFEDGIPVGRYQAEDAKHLSQYVTSELVGAYFDKASLQAVSYMQSKVVAENILAVYGFKKLMQVVILRLCPVRGTPYLGLYVYNENVTRALVQLVDYPEPLWYEVFNLANPDVEKIVTHKWETFWGDKWEYC